MSPGDCARVSDFHVRVAKNAHLTPEALAYEYFENPDAGGRLFFVENDTGQVVGTQAFVARNLRCGAERVPTLMSERTLLDPCKRRGFFFQVFCTKTIALAGQDGAFRFIWGMTTVQQVFERCGFTFYDCLFDLIKIYRLGAVFSLLKDKSATRRQRNFYSLAYLYSRLFSLGSDLIPRRSAPQWRVSEEEPDWPALERLFDENAAANPEVYFLDYTSASLDWLVKRNPHLKRRWLLVSRDADLRGFAVVREAAYGIALIEELIAPKAEETESVCRAIDRHLKRQGFHGARFIANKTNRTQAVLRAVLQRIGYRPLPARVPFMARGVADPKNGAPPIEALAITELWGAPL